MRKQMQDYVLSLQDQIVTAFESLDPNAPKFKRDNWVREQGGLGQSCVFSVPHGQQTEHPTVLEKGGVNISVVHGTLPPAAVKQMRADHSSLPAPEALPPKGLPFFAAGLSLVVHPRNPHAPTVHCNYRYFEITEQPVEGSDEQPKIIAWWFGGGADLTPSYLYTEDAIHFHQTLKSACDQHSSALYPSFKKWCDEYFLIPHRKETRGVGGLFFDDLCDEPHQRLDGADHPRSPSAIFALIMSLGNAFVPSYLPILTKRQSLPYTPEQRRWQLLRRGRYVEFNLVYDRGTKFGLMTPGARIESILMSLPEEARWEYMCDIGEGEENRETEEGKLLQVLRAPRDWL